MKALEKLANAWTDKAAEAFKKAEWQSAQSMADQGRIEKMQALMELANKNPYLDINQTALAAEMMASNYGKQANGYASALGQSLQATKQQVSAGVYAAAAAPRMDPNKVEAYQMKLRDLVTMWEAKFNDRWVHPDDIRDDAFWKVGLRRLQDNGFMETIRSEGWFRLKEHE